MRLLKKSISMSLRGSTFASLSVNFATEACLAGRQAISKKVLLRPFGIPNMVRNFQYGTRNLNIVEKKK